MKKHFDLGYFLREGAKNILTNGAMSFASICMIAACLLIMGSFSLIALNLSSMLAQLEEENTFVAYVDETYSTQESMQLQSKIEAVSNVTEVEFVTREQALENFKEQHSDSTMLDNISASVLRDRYQVHVDDMEKLSETVSEVGQIEGIADVSADYQVAQGFTTIRNIAGIVAVILVVILVVVSLFIISNTVRIATFHRREEIAIMKMCGATNGFVRWPFVFEGLIMGVIGAVVAFFCQWGVYALIDQGVSASDTLSLITLLPFTDLAGYLVAVFLLSGLVIGVGGSLVAIRKFLQV